MNSGRRRAQQRAQLPLARARAATQKPAENKLKHARNIKMKENKAYRGTGTKNPKPWHYKLFRFRNLKKGVKDRANNPRTMGRNLTRGLRPSMRGYAHCDPKKHKNKELTPLRRRVQKHGVLDVQQRNHLQKNNCR